MSVSYYKTFPSWHFGNIFYFILNQLLFSVCNHHSDLLFTVLFCPGLHYIGQVHENSLLRIAFDQITEGQLEFQELNPHFDTVVIGQGKDKREYTIVSGKTEMKTHLMKQFPDETEAIETFFKIMKVAIVSYISFFKIPVL